MAGTGDENSAGPAAPPSSPRPGRSRGVIVAVTVVLLLLGCVVGRNLMNSSPPTTPREAAASSTTARSTPSASPSAAPSATPAQQGPQASEYPAGDVTDLARVCDVDVYYPQSPKRTGGAPHPVVLLEGVPGNRYQNRTYYDVLGGSKTLDRTWGPTDAGKVQLIACLDYESPGSQIRSCTYTRPADLTVALMRATYTLRVYEVATGRQVLRKQMAGDDPKCPEVVLVGSQNLTHAKPTDKAIVAALRGLVTK
ncbi:hypothetical protein [Hamadaea tsunoensis]|uniref:hypothetical protein n=1 Tax=Hamadaea tsunoensis TaxID=53368 RepID=UPI0003FE30CE|nr:hypothetical protein [Hamadaea tsunoensis]